VIFITFSTSLVLSAILAVLLYFILSGIKKIIDMNKLIALNEFLLFYNIKKVRDDLESEVVDPDDILAEPRKMKFSPFSWSLDFYLQDHKQKEEFKTFVLENWKNLKEWRKNPPYDLFP